LAVGLAVLGGCEEEEPGCQLQDGVDPRSQDWGYSERSNVELGTGYLALMESEARAEATRAKVTESCKQLAVALGEPAGAVSEGDPDALPAWCNLAQARIGQAKAGSSVAVSVDVAFCKFSLDEASACEAACSLSSCSAETLEERCPSELLGTCQGTCAGACIGTADDGVACNDACEGACNGTCDGVAASNAACDGTCDGTCNGACLPPPPGENQCDGFCQGSCDVARTGSFCAQQLLPPACELSAQCKAACEALVTARAPCIQPGVGADASPLGLALAAHLPALHGAMAELEGLTAVVAALTTRDAPLDEDGSELFSDQDEACAVRVNEMIESIIVDVEAGYSAAVTITTAVGG
jgi:hypothetical protein